MDPAAVDAGGVESRGGPGDAAAVRCGSGGRRRCHGACPVLRAADGQVPWCGRPGQVGVAGQAVSPRRAPRLGRQRGRSRAAARSGMRPPARVCSRREPPASRRIRPGRRTTAEAGFRRPSPPRVSPTERSVPRRGCRETAGTSGGAVAGVPGGMAGGLFRGRRAGGVRRRRAGAAGRGCLGVQAWEPERTCMPRKPAITASRPPAGRRDGGRRRDLRRVLDIVFLLLHQGWGTVTNHSGYLCSTPAPGIVFQRRSPESIGRPWTTVTVSAYECRYAG